MSSRKKVPIFDTVAEAVKQTGATVSAMFVPPPFAADAILEGADAGLDLVVAITEGIPVNDMIRVKRAMQGRKTRLIGPNCPGIVTPGDRQGFPRRLPHRHRARLHSQKRQHRRRLPQRHPDIRGGLAAHPRGYGQSTCVGIGGDPVNGTSHLDVIKMFNDDPETEGIIMIGEIGGTRRGRSRRMEPQHCKKPMAGFIAGATAPPGRRMGHAGAIVSGGKGTAAAKIARSKRAGIGSCRHPHRTWPTHC